ncbi:MAG: hypothetical protein A2275_10585 [Bacteroidetes bacterium RIFOXYA12_FULL_35_11]|nr:MAG: hypothetical protein A2X01_19900 [Bacteroidetes bacterium GWF2_35_48]OFY76385.1 MAG: hypothetical protein A2275_10585 [Bacteroidetes bacterium RIFOXYA12_FULL_35_11]OFY93325.1 MAG: hypothetical protein A2309_03845 [Bacteroidetes bacterium RIFOXYB2_FULL_35_7]OFZ00049.1 MAG: hypothetical protein A2491_21300 [Bacteroidetes bacterium RIFOXYC12_FULL_35_7]OFZ72850.1 MAG: hypothetical protein A2451_10265 [Bdellovibrionales bacterium RIFOXYC2_FULL_39_8]HBX53292.1 hypothetical protein [Bacteroid
MTDKSIHYALNDFEKILISSIRKSTWLLLDEVLEMVKLTNPGITRSVVCKTFVHEKVVWNSSLNMYH